VAAITKGDWKPESVDGFDRISGVDTPDSLTAVVHYREVYAPYLLQFVRGTLPKHLLQGRDLNTATDYNRAPLGTGPYRVKEWKTGEHILLERVPGYWQGDAKIRQLLFRFVANTTTRINLLKAGEVHLVALLPWDQVREVAPVPGVRLNRVLGNGYEHVTLNQRRVPAFADVRVRRALAHAVDRALLVHTILDGQVAVVDGAVQPLSPAHEPAVRRYGYDTATANRLLDEAGWRRGPDGVRRKDGAPLAFTLITQAGFAIRESVAQALQQAFRAVGVDMSLRLIDGTAISSTWFAGELTLFFAGDRTPPAGRNLNFVNDSALTALLYASDRTVDEARRIALLKEAQRRIAELAPEIPLYNTAKVDAVPATLRGFTGNPTNAGPFWNVHAWEVGAVEAGQANRPTKAP
jgi:peptide/nickel transport system substrate-binding protein